MKKASKKKASTAAVSDFWANRIVEYGVKPADQFLAHELNARRHPGGQRDALRGSLDTVGIEERFILAAYDPITTLADYDPEALGGLLAGLQLDGSAIAEMLEALVAEKPLPYPEKGGGDEFEIKLEGKVRPALGDVWIIGGRHRVICGDSTDPETVARLLGRRVPRLMVTDPPYGVDYDPAWRNKAAAAGHLAYAPTRVGEIANDDQVDWVAAWRLFAGDVVYCWHADRRASEVQRSLEAAEFDIRCQIIWAKSNFPISRGHYHWRHEPCWYGVRKGSTGHWRGDRQQTTLWEINLDKNVEGGLSAQKPLECMQRPIRNHEGDVYDPFLGSGTTLIAAHRENRNFYGCEIEPMYCEVVLRRAEAEGLSVEKAP